MDLHNSDVVKEAKRKTILSIIMAAGICSLLLACVVAVDHSSAYAEERNIVVEMS